MNAPSWWSQPFAPEGSAASEASRSNSVCPAWTRSRFCVRESAQNSLDARELDKSVTFGIEIVRPSRVVLDRWADLLLPKRHLVHSVLPRSSLMTMRRC